jgi:hypothetical protein
MERPVFRIGIQPAIGSFHGLPPAKVRLPRQRHPPARPGGHDKLAIHSFSFDCTVSSGAQKTSVWAKKFLVSQAAI